MNACTSEIHGDRLPGTLANYFHDNLLMQERFFATDEGVHDDGRELIVEHKETVELLRTFIREYNVGGFGLVYRYVKLLVEIVAKKFLARIFYMSSALEVGFCCVFSNRNVF